MAKYTLIRLPDNAPGLGLEALRHNTMQSASGGTLKPYPFSLTQEQEQHLVNYIIKTFSQEVLAHMKKQQGERLHIDAITITLQRGPKSQVLRSPAERSIAVLLSCEPPDKHIALITKRDGKMEGEGMGRDEVSNYPCSRGTAFVLDEGVILGIPTNEGNYPDRIDLLLAKLTYKPEKKPQEK